jgi:lipoprotein-anchoring transpeptidase ErfK/SrfK
MSMSVRRARVASLAALLTVLTVCAATIVYAAHHQTSTASTAASAAVLAKPSPTEPATVTVAPANGAAEVDPTGPVLVTARTGTLTAVTMVNEAGNQIPGAIAPGAKTWSPTIPLGYGRTYTVTVGSVGPGGLPTRQTSDFTTLNPIEQTQVSLNTVGYAPIEDGGRYGVGMVVVAHFDEPVTDKAAAERALQVTTAPRVTGSWFWIDDQTAHWRPERYYAPGTQVTVDARIYGTKLGEGLYGQQDEHVAFTIGDAHVSIADDTTKQVSVYDNGQLVRTMPTSMGMGGTQTIDGHTLSFWTPPGAYTVMSKANPVVMDSSTFGLPIGSRLGYRETIPWATQISGDGIYLHQLNATVWAQGNTDTSHGCLNLNADNAKWFFGFAVPGDVVEVRNTGGPPNRLDQNGDWTMAQSDWIKGSALHG